MKTAKKTAKEIFYFFEGHWRLHRIVRSQTSNIEYKGQVNFHLICGRVGDSFDSLLYSEKVYQNGLSTFSEQKYRYKYDRNKLSISKHFSNDELFYTLNIKNGEVSGEHLCLEDKYLSRYAFIHNMFALTYLVQGPLKNYYIKNLYTKILV